MTALMLSAGKASRLGDIAPAGCKAMTIVGDRTMLDWWGALLGERPTVVCRTEHLSVIPDDVPTVVCDSLGGPTIALKAGLDAVDPEEPVTVIFADTWVPSIPEGDEWCAVAGAAGGRAWYVVEDGLLAYVDLPEGSAALVSIGLYRFADYTHLRFAVNQSLIRFGDSVGLDEVVNRYGLPMVPCFGWQDVGDPDALASWRQIA